MSDVAGDRREQRLGSHPPVAVGGLGPVVHQPPPVGDALDDLLLEAAVLLATEEREQLAEGRGAVAAQIHLHRVAEAQHPRRDVDLDSTRPAYRGQEVAVRERASHHQQGVGLLHHLPARPGPEQADRAGAEGDVVGHRGLAEERLGDPGTEDVGDLDHLVGGVERSGADEHRHLPARVEHVRRPAELVLRREHPGSDEADPGVERLEARRLVGHGVPLLDVGGDDHRGDGPLGLGDAESPVDAVANRRRVVALLHIRGGDVLVEAEEVDLLLHVPADGADEGLADDRDHRLVVDLGVVEAVEEVDRPRPRGRQAHPDPPGELGVAASHERGHLLVSRLHEPDPVALAPERAEDAVDAVAGVPIDGVDAPLDEALTEVVGRSASHDLLRPTCAARGPGRRLPWREHDMPDVRYEDGWNGRR